jgi:hypothetical protein
MSFRTTLPKDVVEQHGHTLDEPGECEMWHFEDEGCVVIDLEGD